ncbi:hypothetical protein CP974_09235 [Streptomyces fradiae ATCC 10745 = DSM 40063]|nr:hypothetical protein CP974_09235 [Streptomyces fradiae ATCC 10745 = DSM 40063]
MRGRRLGSRIRLGHDSLKLHRSSLRRCRRRAPIPSARRNEKAPRTGGDAAPIPSGSLIRRH